MLSYALRRGRCPLALIILMLCACADDPVGPEAPAAFELHAATAGTAVVTNTSGGTDTGSLRWAVSQQTAIVRFDPALAGGTITVDSTLVLVGGQTIEGPADRGITISGGGQRRVIDAPWGATLRNVAITGGTGPVGSAIHAPEGQLLLEHTTVWGNHGWSAAVYGNAVTLINSTVSGNTGNDVSGIAYGTKGGLALFNSTVSHNGPAPGIGRYGDYSPYAPLVVLRDAIIAGNGSPARNCADTVGFHVEGMNISSDDSCGHAPAMLVADPLLGGLADNGGPTMTESIGHRSPAVNAGINCYAIVDQRHVARDAQCDIGAFEFTDFTVVTITIDNTHAVDATGGSVIVTGTLMCSREDQVSLGVQLNQEQKTGKTSAIVRGNGHIGVSCSTQTQPWSVTVVPWSSAFQTGGAVVSAYTNDTPVWVTPAAESRSIRIVRARK